MITHTPLLSSPMAKILLSHDLADMFLKYNLQLLKRNIDRAYIAFSQYMNVLAFRYVPMISFSLFDFKQRFTTATSSPVHPTSLR